MDYQPPKSLFEKCICLVCLSIIRLASLLLAYRYVPICSLLAPRQADARRRIRSKATFQTGSNGKRWYWPEGARGAERRCYQRLNEPVEGSLLQYPYAICFLAPDVSTLVPID